MTINEKVLLYQKLEEKLKKAKEERNQHQKELRLAKKANTQLTEKLEINNKRKELNHQTILENNLINSVYKIINS